MSTHFALDVVDLPGGIERLALITLSGEGRRPAVLDVEAFERLDAVLDAALGSQVSALALIGSGTTFCAGADLARLAVMSRYHDVRELAGMGHRVMSRLAQSPVPSFAFLNGAAMGGGFELALHCTYRVVDAEVSALGLPEVGLGVVPGWGGTWLLPRLVGIERAVQIIVDGALSGGRAFSAAQMTGWGAVDEQIGHADFLVDALGWTATVLRGQRRVSRPPVDRDERTWNAVIERTRRRVELRLHGANRAPERALDLLSAARTADRAAGFALEDDALAELVMTDEHRASVYAFDLSRSRARAPRNAPDPGGAQPIRSAGVVGAGLMATQLAVLIAGALDIPVIMTDLDQARVDKGVNWVGTHTRTLAAKGRVSPEKATRITELVSGSVDKAALGGADLVVEAVFEDLGVKRAMLRELEPVLSPTCIIATNTSALSLAAMAGVLLQPDRFVGMHFFNPVARMPLLEIIPAPTTSSSTLATAFDVGGRLGKSCVLVHDAPGFVVSRLLGRMYVELLRTVDEGTPLPVADRALDPLGLPMSAFELLALIGPPVQLHINETLAAAWPERFPISVNLQAIAASGQKSVFDPDDRQRVLPEVQQRLVQGDVASSAARVLARVRDALADEVWRMLDEDVVAQASDIDACMLLGAGWPAHLGGITPWLDRTAPDPAARRFHPPGVASVVRSAPEQPPVR